MKITVMMEGKSERAFLPLVREFVGGRICGDKPRIVGDCHNGRIPKGEFLRRDVLRLLKRCDYVIALTDVYTGSRDFTDAGDAKRKMREWVGENDRFFPHAAQYEFEAWLIPYWEDIKRIAGSRKSAPSGNPEHINHGYPPSRHLADVFKTGSRRRCYDKLLSSAQILAGKDLTVAANACPELKAFLNSLLSVSGGELLA